MAAIVCTAARGWGFNVSRWLIDLLIDGLIYRSTVRRTVSQSYPMMFVTDYRGVVDLVTTWSCCSSSPRSSTSSTQSVSCFYWTLSWRPSTTRLDLTWRVIWPDTETGLKTVMSPFHESLSATSRWCFFTFQVFVLILPANVIDDKNID